MMTWQALHGPSTKRNLFLLLFLKYSIPCVLIAKLTVNHPWSNVVMGGVRRWMRVGRRVRATPRWQCSLGLMSQRWTPPSNIHRGKRKFQHSSNECGQKQAWASSSRCMEKAPGESGFQWLSKQTLADTVSETWCPLLLFQYTAPPLVLMPRLNIFQDKNLCTVNKQVPWCKFPGALWMCQRSAFPGGSDGKESTCNVTDLGSVPGLGRSPGEGNGNPLQYSCLENPMDRGAWWATVHRVTWSWTWLSNYTTTTDVSKICMFSEKVYKHRIQWNPKTSSPGIPQPRFKGK